ncbi:MAG: carbohydrate ABC transporter substrate-binding protein [Spirochaetales bacterium]|nr:carbohydrate ABC transporter substrate-binding protein [Spirochaetales bacterium]
MSIRTKMMALAALLLVTALPVFATGGQEEAAVSQNPAEMSGKIVVWSFTDEVGGMIEHFNQKYPNIEVEYVVIPNQDEVYLNKLVTTLRSRDAVPDVFTGEAAFFRQFVEAGFWEPISDAPYNAEELKDNLVPYVVGLSRDANGKMTALSWQATPGAMFYRRSIAKEVLGTDDPAEVSKWTSDINKYYELGEMIKEKYNGEKFLVSGYTDMAQFIYNQRKVPYVVDNTLTVPGSLIEYMELAKDMRTNKVEGGVGTWSPAWFSGMADASVFTYILPTWGLHYVLKPNAEPEASNGEKEFSGDWGLCVPPAAYSWGGTYIGISRFSEKKDLAWAFVKHIGSDPEFAKYWAEKTGDFVGNLNVVKEIKDDFADPFLGGQNHYEYFYNEVKKIDVSRVGPWDFQIENAWGDQVELYANGEKTKQEAMDGFVTAMADILPDVKVVFEGR